jgi:hypothetical protein
MDSERKTEITSSLTDYEPTVEFLLSLPEDRYQIVFQTMKLVKLLECQRISAVDIRDADNVRTAYSMSNISKLVLMAFMYGKIQGKREDRAKRK